jgi:hypothetical protein
MHSVVVPGARLATSRFRSQENQENAFVRFVAGPGMGYGADIAPLLLHTEATAMRATCVQMGYAIERVAVWPTPVAALWWLDLSGNTIGDAGAAALAAELQVRLCACVLFERFHRVLGSGQDCVATGADTLTSSWRMYQTKCCLLALAFVHPFMVASTRAGLALSAGEHHSHGFGH